MLKYNKNELSGLVMSIMMIYDNHILHKNLEMSHLQNYFPALQQRNGCNLVRTYYFVKENKHLCNDMHKKY